MARTLSVQKYGGNMKITKHNLASAVADGIITQAQADQVLASGFPGIGGGFEFGPGGFGGHGGRGHGGFENFGGGQNNPPITPSTPAPTTTPSSSNGGL